MSHIIIPGCGTRPACSQDVITHCRKDYRVASPLRHKHRLRHPHRALDTVAIRRREDLFRRHVDDRNRAPGGREDAGEPAVSCDQADREVGSGARETERREFTFVERDRPLLQPGDVVLPGFNRIVRVEPAADAVRVYASVKTVGAGRFMLGSDYPFAVGDLDKAVQIIGALGLSAADREAIESGNALSVLR